LQAIFNELFSLLDKGENCDFAMVEFAVRNKIFSFKPMFQNMLQLISQRQKELLYAIAKEGKATGITSGKFIKKHGLQSSGSVQTASNQLLEKEIVTSENGIYQVYDRFFGLWLSDVYGTGFKI
jgi:hypothetical protein